MAAGRVIHIGTDHCHRLPVLESAGYRVDGCCTVVELRKALNGDRRGALEAVLVAERERAAYQDMIREVREHSTAPVVLFRDTLPLSKVPDGEAPFDMEVPVLEPPQAWLLNLATLIARSQAARAQSRQFCGKSQLLCLEVAELREKSRRERQRSKEVKKRIAHPEGVVRGPVDGEDD